MLPNSYLFQAAILTWASLVAQMAKNLPALQKTWVQSLGPEDPLEEEMATHSNILAWRISWSPVCQAIVHSVPKSGHD